jgi:tetratricopeptide (TPR) repeat protein
MKNSICTWRTEIKKLKNHLSWRCFPLVLGRHAWASCVLTLALLCLAMNLRAAPSSTSRSAPKAPKVAKTPPPTTRQYPAPPTVEEIQRLIQHNEAILRTPPVYKAVALTLALYCQSPSRYWPEHLDSAWLPGALEEAGHPRGSINAQGAYCELGGGFYHYGYKLDKDAVKSTPQVNVWRLWLQREEQDDELLHTLSLPRTQGYTESVLLRQVGAGYDRQIRAALRSPAPDTEGEGRFQQLSQTKIKFLLRMGRADLARQACARMLAQQPDDWWAQLVNTWIRASQMRSPQQAEKPLRQWVARHSNFFSYLDLAYYYQLQKQPKEAARAMMSATKYNANVPWGHGGNAEYRGYTAAMYAFQNGQFVAAIALCTQLLKVTINGDYAKPGLRALRSAAQEKARGRRVTLVWDRDMGVFDPFEGVDLRGLIAPARSVSPRRTGHTS